MKSTSICRQSHRDLLYKRALKYTIAYSPATEEHLRALTARQRSIVFGAVDQQLGDQPGVETRNRKPMRPNPIAPWELRLGEIRVYYDFIENPEKLVTVLAVGIKDGNRVLLAGEEVEL
jgi:mRNA-degrading endonuclease RelE of RelBE toxin-antitoxin system